MFFLYITIGTTGFCHEIGIVLLSVMDTIFHYSDAPDSIPEK